MEQYIQTIATILGILVPLAGMLTYFKREHKEDIKILKEDLKEFKNDLREFRKELTRIDDRWERLFTHVMVGPKYKANEYKK